MACLDVIISALNMAHPVIVSPSMSGRLSLPYLTAHPERVRGFLPVAPVSTSVFSSHFPNIQVDCYNRVQYHHKLLFQHNTFIIYPLVLHTHTCTQARVHTVIHSQKVPTVIFYGDRDKNLGVKSLENLSLLPNKCIFQVTDASHAAYLNQPNVWHTVIYNFLQHLISE